jgi:hypothetical protein
MRQEEAENSLRALCVLYLRLSYPIVNYRAKKVAPLYTSSLSDFP